MKTKTKLPKARPSKSRSTRAVPKAKLIRKRKIRKQGSLYDWVKEFSGILDGPGDLNTNPKYMEGYGQ